MNANDKRRVVPLLPPPHDAAVGMNNIYSQKRLLFDGFNNNNPPFIALRGRVLSTSSTLSENDLGAQVHERGASSSLAYFPTWV